jgi:hypothetical protein
MVVLFFWSPFAPKEQQIFEQLRIGSSTISGIPTSPILLELIFETNMIMVS